MLDQGTAEELSHESVDASAAGERYRRQRVIAEGTDVSDGLADRFRRLGCLHPQREGRRGDGARARPAEPVDDDSGPGEFLVDAEVRKPPGAAAG